MTLQAQPLGVMADTGGASSYNLTPSTYPTTGRRIFVAVESDTDPTGVSGLGLTWTQRSSVDDGTGFLTVWEGEGTVTASGNVTASFGSTQSGCRMALHQGYDDAGGSVAIRRWGTGSGSGTTTSATMASTDSGDLFIGFSASNNTAIQGQTDNTNWSDGQGAGHGAPARHIRTNESSVMTTTPSPAVNGSSTGWRCIVVELYVTSSGTTYDDTGLEITVAATVDGSEQLTMAESGDISTSSAVDGTDGLTMSESGDVQVFAIISSNDGLVFTETLELAVTATVDGSDNPAYTHEGDITITATLDGSDALSMNEGGTITSSSSVDGSDDLAGSEALEVSVVAVIDGTDVSSMSDTGDIVFVAIISGYDEIYEPPVPSTRRNERGVEERHAFSEGSPADVRAESSRLRPGDTA